jgi:hypothetical protein
MRAGLNTRQASTVGNNLATNRGYVRRPSRQEEESRQRRCDSAPSELEGAKTPVSLPLLANEDSFEVVTQAST